MTEYSYTMCVVYYALCVEHAREQCYKYRDDCSIAGLGYKAYY